MADLSSNISIIILNILIILINNYIKYNTNTPIKRQRKLDS